MKRERMVSLSGLLILVLVSIGLAQEKPNPTRQSQLQARQVLYAGINALGGVENISRADKITIHYRSVNHPLGQNAAFNAEPAVFQRIGLKTLIDYSGNRYVTEGQSNSAGGYKFNFRFVSAPKRSFSIDVLQNRRGPEVRDLDERTKNQLKIGSVSEVPHLLLLHVSQRPEKLRSLGETEINGEKFRVVSFATENGAGYNPRLGSFYISQGFDSDELCSSPFRRYPGDVTVPGTATLILRQSSFQSLQNEKLLVIFNRLGYARPSFYRMENQVVRSPGQFILRRLWRRFLLRLQTKTSAAALLP